jgi:hypothetical protein
VLVKIKKADVEAERQRIIDEMKRKTRSRRRQVRAAEQAIAAGKVLDAGQFLHQRGRQLHQRRGTRRRIRYLHQPGLESPRFDDIEPATDNPNKATPLSRQSSSSTVYYAGANGRITVQNAKVAFTLRENRGDYTPSSISGANGVVACRITRLESVNNSTKLYARIGIDVQPILNAGATYSHQANAHLTAADRVSSTYSFNVAAEANLRLKTCGHRRSGRRRTYNQRTYPHDRCIPASGRQGLFHGEIPDGINLRKLTN